jgi:hypothetical protein
MRTRRYTDEELSQAVSSSTSIRGVLKMVGLVEAGGNYAIIKERIQQLNLDTTHFHGQGWRKGSSKPPKSAQELINYLVKGQLCRSSHLRLRLIREGYKEAICEMCRQVEWLGKPIPLELDHLNGDKADNRLENLRLLCCNCHALTSNYRGKNIRMRRDSTGAA